MFIGRKRELEELKDALTVEGFSSTLVFGNHRVGKTALVSEALKGYEGKKVVVEFVRGSLKANLDNLCESFFLQMGMPIVRFEKFRDFFEMAFSFSKSVPFVLFLDEFSFLLEKDFNIESTLASCIDRLRDDSMMKLVVSGSDVRLMERMISHEAHCFGRFDKLIRVRPFGYRDASFFYPDYSPDEKFRTYAVFGGLPFLNAMMNPKVSFLENLKELVLRKDSRVDAFMNYGLLPDLDRVANLKDAAVLIARGIRRHLDLVRELKRYGNERPEYLLGKLVDLEIVEKCFPLNRPGDPRKAYYRFTDNYLSFYFRHLYVSPFSHLRNDPDAFYDSYVRDDFEMYYLPAKFREISWEFLVHATTKRMISPAIRDIGCYFFDDPATKTNREFDVVTKDRNGYVAYECKYSSSPIGLDVVEEEREQTLGLPIGFHGLGFISRSGFKDDVDRKKYRCFSLGDFYLD